MTTTDDNAVKYVNLFCPLDGQQTVEIFWLGRADVLQDMGEPLPSIFPKIPLLVRLQNDNGPGNITIRLSP